jgi:2-polyprenyl-3-methyl-5-hydroxy-6-metoxy-1,4-benzoquinol methylase
MSTAYADLARDYTDPAGTNPHVRLIPLPQMDFSGCAVEFVVTVNGQTIRRPVWYSHLALLKLIKHYDFRTVLDVGTNDGMVPFLLEGLGKDVVGLEPGTPYQNHPDYPCREPDIEGDYLDVKFIKKFDVIWCSHVLEHVRNPGMFLDKMFDDLKDDGILALTVPYQDASDNLNAFLCGHHNKYNQWNLLYQLICAGFDCREASVAAYCGMFSVIVRKRRTNIHRGTCGVSYVPAHKLPKSYDAAFHDPKVLSYFPVDMGEGCTNNASTWINWGNPI